MDTIGAAATAVTGTPQPAQGQAANGPQTPSLARRRVFQAYGLSPSRSPEPGSTGAVPGDSRSLEDSTVNSVRYVAPQTVLLPPIRPGQPEGTRELVSAGMRSVADFLADCAEPPEFPFEY